MDGTVAEGLRVLAAIAAGADAPGAIAARLDLPEDAVASHLEALVAGGFVRHDGGRLALADRLTGLLDGLVGRVDLLAIAAPIVLEAEARLGLRIDVAIADEDASRTARSTGAFAIVADDDGTSSVVTWARDMVGEVACVLRTSVDGAEPAVLEALGKELAATADAISARLPVRKDRGPDWELRY